MNQHRIYEATGLTELGLNESITVTRGSGDQDPRVDLHVSRMFNITEQEGSPYFLTPAFHDEHWGRFMFDDVPYNEPHHEPVAYPEPSAYAPCEQQAYVSEADGWTLVTTFDLSAQPTPFKSLEIGTVFFDPFARDMVRKTSDLRGVVVASDEPITGTTYGYVDGLIPMNNTVYPVLPLTAQHLADGPSAQDLLVAQEWAPGSPADALLQVEGAWVPEPLATDPGFSSTDHYPRAKVMPQDHPEGWNAPAQACMAAYAKDPDSVEVDYLDLDGLPQAVYPLPPSEDTPETQGIPITYKVAMGNCYRLFHHGRQIAIVPNYAQAEVIAQALAATFAGRLADFSLTLDFIEGATP